MMMIMTTTSDRYEPVIRFSYATTVTTTFEIQEKENPARTGPRTLRSDSLDFWRLPFRTPGRSMYEPHDHHAMAWAGQVMVSLVSLRSTSTPGDPAPRAGSSFARSVRPSLYRIVNAGLCGGSSTMLVQDPSPTSTHVGRQSQGCNLLMFRMGEIAGVCSSYRSYGHLTLRGSADRARPSSARTWYLPRGPGLPLEFGLRTLFGRRRMLAVSYSGV